MVNVNLIRSLRYNPTIKNLLLPNHGLRTPAKNQTDMNLVLFPPPSFPRTHYTKSPSTSRKHGFKMQSTAKFGNFLDFKPEHQPQALELDLPWCHPSDLARFDVIIIGAGPAGLRLAEQVSLYGVKVCCIDPEPLSLWPNNYGVWVYEFENIGLEDCFDRTWPKACVYIDDSKTKLLERCYGRVSRKKLKQKLVEGCVSNGVRFYKAKAFKIEHQEFESSVLCDDGKELKGSLIVDASGFVSTFIEYDKVRNYGFQVAYGILAEVDGHPFDLDQVVLMDWRDSHLENEPYLKVSNSKFPTFLYAMPFDSNLIFLEETCLVSRPALSNSEVEKRMVARLRHLGISVKRILEDERGLIPMGGPLPRIPQNVMATGGNSGVVHPATGYMMARTMVVSCDVAVAIVECLGSTRMIRGKQLYAKVWNTMWPIESRLMREFYSFGMETPLELDLNETKRFFDAFFALEPYYLHKFLSSSLSLEELVWLSMSLIKHASNRSRLDVLIKCPVPFAKMIANIIWEYIR